MSVASQTALACSTQRSKFSYRVWVLPSSERAGCRSSIRTSMRRKRSQSKGIFRISSRSASGKGSRATSSRAKGGMKIRIHSLSKYVL
jgi:hypothetical protein